MYPVSLRRSPGSDNPLLELFLYKGRLQLAASDVLYSDGHKYIPAVAVCDHFKESLRYVKNVLILGSGLGSLMDVLTKKGYTPNFTLVEKDSVVLKWALEFADEKLAKKIEPICEDAAKFMQRNEKQYTLIFIDVFYIKTVPKFVFSDAFLIQCRDSIAQGGHVAFNYIVHDAEEWKEVQRAFSRVFPEYKIISRGVNKILVA